MSDHFKDHANSLTSPANSGRAVTPSDTNDLPDCSRALYIGGGGSLAVELVGSPGQVVTLNNVQAGVMYPLRVSKILASGTSATQIVCFW